MRKGSNNNPANGIQVGGDADSSANSGTGSSGNTGATLGTTDSNTQAFNDINSLGNDLESLGTTTSGLDQNVDITA